MIAPADSGSPDQKLENTVEKQARRIKRAEKERRTLVGETVYLGTLGVMFVLPVIAGAYVGEWLDKLSQGYEVHWTISMIVLGVVVGAFNVYFFIRER
ncbi:MAG TPA: AtpZ/AtpI family protein [Candidatus Binatia bacterium]